MTGYERLEMFALGIEPETQVCINCEHFHRHYIHAGSQYAPIELGHCCYPRTKQRGITESCKYFDLKERK